jgi:hypothetical protein
MDTEDDIKNGVVKLVTAPPRVLSWKEEAPRPMEVGWVRDQIERQRITGEPYSSISWRW